MANHSSRYLIVRAAGRLQAVPADEVRAVVKLAQTTRVPHAPPGLIGLANVRGTAVPILSVAALQGKSRVQEDRVLVIDRADPVGLLVDEVREIAEAKGRTRALDIDALVALAIRPSPARAMLTQVRSAPAPSKTVAHAALDMVSFIAGGQEFALPLDQVQEVIGTPSTITRLPDADRAVIGTIEHRGGLLPLLTLASLLGLADRGAEGRRIVVALVRGHLVGLIVDAMRSVLRVEEGYIDPVPTVLARRAGEARIQAIARLEDGRRLVSILAADKLFDDALMAQIGDRRDTQAESEADMTADATEPFLIVRLGAQSFGLPALSVEEIVRLPETLTRLPRAPDFVEGVMNLRGHAIPVIDQRRRFGDESSTAGQRRAIVVRIGSLQAAFIVDEVTEIHRLAAASIAPAPDISDATRLFDRTAVMPDGNIVLLIEPTELLDGTEQDLLTGLKTDMAGT